MIGDNYEQTPFTSGEMKETTSKFLTIIKVLITLLLFVVILIGIIGLVSGLIAYIIVTNKPTPQNPPLPLSNSSYDQNVIIVGDWGLPGIEQNNVANAMELVAKREKIDFIISTGDNFYYEGVDSISDPLWQSVYEGVYNSKENLKKLDWYSSLGNHDWIKNYSAQIDYSRVNNQWILPSKYYTKEFQFPNSGYRIQYIFLDTCPYSVLEYHRNPKIRSENSTLQTQWLRKVLSEGNFQWRFVIGHHPFYSSGHYGDIGNKNMSVLEDIFNEFKIDGYYNGHQHILEHSQTRKNGVEVNYFISGAGGQPASNDIVTPNHPRSVYVIGKQEGFMTLKFNRTFATTSFYNRLGQMIYNYTINKP